MQLERLLAFFATSPAIRLLRSPQAPHIVHFLNENFKETGRITWPQADLVARLAGFQEQIHAEGFDVLRDRAETYLNDWSTTDSRWLTRRLEAGVSEPIYELSPHTELVLRFLRETLQKRLGFVGTESRLRRIIDTLSSLVIQSNDDPQRRIEYLKAERARIDDEILTIETDGIVSTFSPTAIRERFSEAVEDLMHLQGDFRDVEESFKQITRDVQRRHADANDSRGEILGYALDAEDSLKSNDQGVSFHEFVRLILSPNQQDALEEVIARLDEITELADQFDGLRRIHAMVPSLLAEATKVLRTTQRLSTTLRRLLDSNSAGGRMRLTRLLKEIRQTAGRLADAPPIDQVDLNVETELQITSVSERSFWTPAISFETTEMRDAEPDQDDRLAAFKTLALMRRLDWNAMRQRIKSELTDREQLGMAEMFAEQPPLGGVVEVLGYLQIAHDDGHQVDPEQTDTLHIPFDDYAEMFDDPSGIPRAQFLSHRGTRVLGYEDTGDDISSRTLVLEVPRVTFRPLADGVQC